MELNKNSKYNSYYLLFNNYLPNNFCDYFWGSIKSLLMTIFLLFSIFIVGSVLIAPITLFWFNSPKETFWDFCQNFGLMTYGILFLMFIVYKTVEYFDNKSYKYKKESIIKIWYKDFKNKHCTLITWKDEK